MDTGVSNVQQQVWTVYCITRLVAQLENAQSRLDGWWQSHLMELERRIQLQQLTERRDEVFVK